MTDTATAAAPAPAKRTVQTLSFQQLRQLQFPPEDLIIGNGLLTRNSIMVIAAPPKSYKSFILNTVILQLLIGGNLFGAKRSHARQTEHLFSIQPVKRILLIEQEIGLRDTQERLVTFFNTLPDEQRRIIDENLFIRSCDYDLRLDAPVGLNKIRAIVEQVRPEVLCIDPLTKFHTSEENSPSEMGKIMLELRRMIHDFNLTVIMLHHTGKNEEGKSGLDLLRGASSIAGDIDTGMCLHVINKSASIIWVDLITRRGKPLPCFKVKLDHQTLRTEFHGWAKAKESYQQEAVLSEVQEITDKKQ